LTVLDVLGRWTVEVDAVTVDVDMIVLQKVV
jgi:hypothetical protein